MDDLKARAALKLGVPADELHAVVIREEVGWPPMVVVLYTDYRKVKFPAAELPELPKAAEPARPVKPARKGQRL